MISKPWTDIFIQHSLLSVKSAQSPLNYDEGRIVFHPPMHYFIFVLNLICHFIVDSPSLMKTFCNGSPFTSLTIITQLETCHSFLSGNSIEAWTLHRDSSSSKIIWLSCCYALLRTSWALREAWREPAGKPEDCLAHLHECRAQK